MVVVIAMLVVLMAIVVMMVVVTMRTTMRGVLVRTARRGVCMSAAGIGAAFRIERRFDLGHACAQPFDHRFDDVIPPDAQTLRDNLSRQMTVAEMPGEANQMVRIDAPDLNQRLRRSDDLDQPAIVKHQRVAAAQHGCVFEIEQEHKATRARHRHPPPMTIVEIEYDGIDRRLRPVMLGPDLRRADHARTLIGFGQTFLISEYRRWQA